MSASSILATGLRSVANTPFRVDSTRQILQKSTRCYATAQPKMKNNKERRVKPGKHKPPPERDATGALVFKKQEKRGGVFRPLPASQLSHPILQGNESEQLKLPVFCPTLVTPEMVGKPVAFAIDGSSPFNKFGVTKKTLLEYRLASQPYSVVRDVTLKLAERIDAAAEVSTRKNRMVLTGPSGCGKTVLLMQAVAYCAAKEWLTIYIPRAAHLVDSTTPYVYDLRTRLFHQHTASVQLLQRFLGTNGKLLEGMTTLDPHEFDKHKIPAGTPLTALIKLGLEERSLSPFVLRGLFHELAYQKTHPVLLAIDDFQALYCMSRYKDPHFNSIRPYHLSLPRLLLEFASNRYKFKRGLVLGAITDSDPSWRPSLELREALDLPHTHPTSPYDKRSTYMTKYTNRLEQFPVPPQLNVDEAASIFDFWKADRAYDSTVSDELFLSKYTESSGNAREFVWKGLLSNFDPR